MKKIISLFIVCLLSLLLVGCKNTKTIKIAVPNDTTNEARALAILENLGFIKLKEGAGITATKLDIVDNPYNVEIVEMDAAQIPNALKDVHYAVINSNYAIDAKLNPATDALALEGSYSAYGNIIAVKQGNENNPLVLALTAALKSKQVKDFIANKYSGSVVSTVDNTTDGYDSNIDYESLKGKEITIAASPTPHAEILNIVKEILASKNITLKIIEFTDYVQPNNVVESGEVLANYFQHVPYLEDFNSNNNTHLVSVASIHVEPMGVYGGKFSSLEDIKKW